VGLGAGSEAGIARQWYRECGSCRQRGGSRAGGSVGLTGDAPLLVDTTPDAAIVLQPAKVYPIEIYS
jgi:hypothetical protein